MGIIPGPVITGPEPLRTRYGLFTAAVGPLDLPEPQGRGGGVRYIPRTCGTANTFPIACENEQVSSFTKALDEFQEAVEALPFGVFASLECGSVGFTASEIENLARERLDDGEQHATEQTFWTGRTDLAVETGINSLEDSATDITAADPLAIESAVADLEDWLYRQQEYGYVGFIHAPVRVAAVAANSHLVIDDRGIKRTPYGSIWVFGGGYPGTGADGEVPPNGGSFMHITGQVAVWRAAEPFVYPANDVFDREANQRLMIAEREYAVGFDCHNARILFNPLGGV